MDLICIYSELTSTLQPYFHVNCGILHCSLSILIDDGPDDRENGIQFDVERTFLLKLLPYANAGPIEFSKISEN